MNIKVSRRQFIVHTVAGLAGLTFLPKALRAQSAEAASKASLFVIHGRNIADMLAAGMAKMGGWKTFVKPGKPVVLKVNAAWASNPEEGGNTNPVLAEEFIHAARAVGASEVSLPEKSCSPAKESFERSGIKAAAERAGGRLYSPSGKDFRKVDIPRGVSLKQAEVVGEVLDSECLVNMPVAKVHGGATLTLSMKNWMGSVSDRGAWHRNNLHQCIADMSTVIKPHLIVLDATRILLTNGPRGPGKMAHPDQIVFGTDPVAVDAYAATLFDMKPFSVNHIKFAHDMGIGCGDLSLVRVEHVTV